MADQRKASEPIVPEIRKCPRCGHNVLIGDTICSRCRYNLSTPTQRLKQQPPMVVAVAGFGIGILIALASFGMDRPWQFFALITGFGFIIGGGLYYAYDLLILNADDRRKK